MPLCGTSKDVAKILEALGIEPNRVRGFELKVTIDTALTLSVEYLPDKIDGQGMDKVFRKYRLEEI